MPLRPFSRDQVWLLPPSLDELVGADHPARFVADFVDGLDRVAWRELGVALDGEALGAPAYHPRALLCVWLYGFMSGVRSSRKLEAACRDQLSYLWLTGWQRPDHNTLWRFYEERRPTLRKLFKRTVKTAVRLGLVDLALQAIDGTKVAASAAKERTADEKRLRRLLEGTDRAIRDLEAQNSTPSDPVPARLPERLAEAKALREAVRKAIAEVEAEEGRGRVNLTDEDAALVKSRQGVVTGYNAQAAVSRVALGEGEGSGLLITAAEVTNEPDDHERMLPMLEQAEENVGQKSKVSLFDGGYHSGPNLALAEAHGYRVLMPESAGRTLEGAYHKERFAYDKGKDCYRCPEGKTLSFRGTKQREGRPETKVYLASKEDCLACPAFGACTKDARHGRALEVGPHEELLHEHRELMAKEESKMTYGGRKELPEPAFGIIKEQQNGRRFLLRGLSNVGAEWLLLVTAFNLRTLYRLWRGQAAQQRKLLWQTASA